MSAAADSHQGVALAIRGLRKSYGSLEVLKGIDLDVKAGEIFVIMGPSGSGKSVFLRHLIGLETPDAGEIRIEGESIQADDVMSRYRMGMVFQTGGLLNSLTVEENVGLYLTEHRLKPPAEIARIVREKLALVQLQDVEDKFPNELSGGMRKRVAIARALVSEPQLILYDEPTSELDPMVAVTIGHEVLKLNQRTGATSIVVTHDRDLAFGIADRIAFIADGEFLALGTPEEVRQTNQPLLRQFLAADFKAPV